MIDDREFRSVTSWLEECHPPLLVSHQRPDGDSLGALTAMAAALRGCGKEPLAVLYAPLPAPYAFLSDATEWRQWSAVRDTLAARCDALVIVDTCALAQLEPIGDFLPDAPRTLVIDHHATRDAIGLRPGDLRCFDETASAVCLIIAEWARSAGIELDQAATSALFVGIATDTGWFRFTNTDARTLRVAAELLDGGADASALYRALYLQDPPEKVHLVARALAGLTLEAGGRLAVMRLRRADFEATGADGSMTENLINEAARLGSTEATLLFTEDPDGVVRVNFRSKQRLDVAELARRFGGGGHARAAGARVRGRWDDVVPQVLAATIAAL